MTDDWIRASPRSFYKRIHFHSPDGIMIVRVHATRKTKDAWWHLSINYRRIADFETFEELDGVVPVLVNAYLNRSEQ